MNVNIKQLKRNLLNKKVSEISSRATGRFSVLTDRVGYQKSDQVFPLHPENQFFLDEMRENRFRNNRVLEIGVGSGVLSIAALRAGASSVIGLEINPRAIQFAAYNFIANGVEGRVEVRQGSKKDIFSPVSDTIFCCVCRDYHNEKFDLIISNPPFEPTPPGIGYYMHSSGGMYGLDVVEKILFGLYKHLNPNGNVQIVSFSPGSETEPFMLIDMVKSFRFDSTTIVVNPMAIPFDHFAQRFLNFGLSEFEITQYVDQARQEGITHLHMCMIHIQNSGSHFEVVHSDKTYENWDLPIDSVVPMGFEEELPFGKNTPKFTIRADMKQDDESVWVGKCNGQGPRERLGKLVEICDTMDEADAILKEINADWGQGRTFRQCAFLLEVAPMVERNSFRTPKEKEETVFLVIDPKG